MSLLRARPVPEGVRTEYDVIVVGGGPAGLSAALLLGRCCRRVLVCDSGTPRNARSRALHAFLTRDGVDPWELRRLGREQLVPYGVEYREVAVSDAQPAPGGFEVSTGAGERISCRKLLLATGVRDLVPSREGFDACYGRTVFHCPYCDGWEVRGKRLAVFAPGGRGGGLALTLTAWSAEVLLCTDGRRPLSADLRGRLNGSRVAVRTERVAGLEHAEGHLRTVRFEQGPAEPCSALFLATGQEPQSDLARRLGCRFNRKGTVSTGRHEQTGIPGLFVAGDASRDVQLAVVAAAEGVKAAFAINTELHAEGR
jgi:thioredoxin reductase